MKRRQLLQAGSLGALAAGMGSLGPSVTGASLLAAQQKRSGLPPIKITDVKCILTAPAGRRLAVVKVSTSEPELYGLGCATFTQRFGGGGGG